MIYHFDKTTKELIGSSITELDPIDKLPLIPANATDIEPPVTNDSQAAVFDGVWSVAVDERGYVGYDQQGVEHEISELGVSPDPNWTLTKPFILSDAQQQKSAELEDARNNAMFQHLISDALGAGHTYSVTERNNNFLNNLITLGNGSKFTCVDENGLKERVFHTNAQLIVLANDIEAHISDQFNHHELKLAELAAATTQAQIDLVVW